MGHGQRVTPTELNWYKLPSEMRVARLVHHRALKQVPSSSFGWAASAAVIKADLLKKSGPKRMITKLRAAASKSRESWKKTNAYAV